MRCVVRKMIWCPMLEWDVAVEQCEGCKYYGGIDEDGYIVCEGPSKMDNTVGVI